MKKYIIATSIIILIAAVGGGFYYTSHRTKAPKPTIVTQKKDAPAQTSQQTSNEDKTTEQTPISNTLQVENIVSSESSGYVSATANITGTDNSSGSCIFTYENSNAKPVVRQIAVTITANSSSCNSGNIPAVEFSVVGSWKLTVRYFDGTSQAVNSVDVNIQ